MKKAPKLILILALVCFNFASAQTAITNRVSSLDTRRFEGNWSFGLGVNAVNDSGNQFNNFFDFKENMAFTNPITLSIEYYIDPQFSVYTTASFNAFKQGKKIDGAVVADDDPVNFFAMDLGGKYSFRNWIQSNVFAPYGAFGIGITKVSSYTNQIDNTPIEAVNRFTINPSLGVNIWCTRSWGINMNAAAKFNFNSEKSSYAQYGLGVVYLIPFKYKNEY